MKKKQLKDLLVSLTHNLKADSKQEKKRIEDLQQSLAEVLLTQDVPIKMDFPRLFGQSISSKVPVDKKTIHRIVDQAKPLEKKDQMLVEMRLSDFKTNLFLQAKEDGVLKNILPSYTGLKKIKTEGPFTRKDGSGLFFDFYPYLINLNSLYIEGQALPALLFKTRIFRFPLAQIDLTEFGKKENIFGKDSKVLELFRQEKKKETKTRKVRERLGKIKKVGKVTDIKIGSAPIRAIPPEEIIKNLPKTTRLYQIVGNTVWVRANLLSPSAPNGHYCALQIKNGTVFLDKVPIVEEKNKITISKTTSVTVNLNLVQKTAPTSNDETFGLDAKNATQNFPSNFSFSLKNTQKTIIDIGDIQCKVYGKEYHLSYKNAQNIDYNTLVSSISIPFKCNPSGFSINRCESALVDVSGEATIKNTSWTLLSHIIDLQKPLEADGNGGLLFECQKGLSVNLKNTDEIISLNNPTIFIVPQTIKWVDQNSIGQGFHREVNLWQEETKPFGTTIEIDYLKEAIFLYEIDGKGEENLITFADLKLKVDRPLKVNAEPIAINTKQSILYFKGVGNSRNILIFDPDLLKDNYIPPTPNQPDPEIVEPIAFALTNALLTATPPAVISLMGKYDEDFQSIYQGKLMTLFGLFKYIPTLPDPYAANISNLFRQNLNNKDPHFYLDQVILLLENTTTWVEDGKVSTAFDFLVPIDPNKTAITGNEKIAAYKMVDAQQKNFQDLLTPKEDFIKGEKESVFRPTTDGLNKNPNEGTKLLLDIIANFTIQNRFTLLDVSSNANQVGVNFRPYQNFVRFDDKDPGNLWSFPFKIENLDVVSQGINTQAFMLPQISWEPTFNLADQDVTDGTTLANDPPKGFNYYPNDGLPTLIGNYSKNAVALSPIPLSQFLQSEYESKNNKATYALFNLPFGMIALSILDRYSAQKKKPQIKNITPTFREDVAGGIQLELTAGSSFAAEGDLFQGITDQNTGVLDWTGFNDKYSTLGSSVHEIFTSEFSEAPTNPKNITRPAVPLERIGLSGYGASTFSDWRNKNAAFAATSQATFNVAIGRTMKEIVQVKSVIYPWGIFVVRTITILRLSSGYIIRLDSGWQAQSDGKFYYGVERNCKLEENPYEYHPGLIKGLFNIRNIRENNLPPFKGTTTIKDGDYVFNPATNKEEEHKGHDISEKVLLRGLTFDADIDIEGVIEGQDSKTKLVPSKGVLGFVQLRPSGAPVKAEVLRALLETQEGSIGGPVNCTISVAHKEQHIKINRVDVNNSTNKNNAPIFVVAARGSVILPKEGSWTMVTHEASSGTVTPLDKDMSVPLIRVGKSDFGELINAKDLKNLQRIAHPTELIREPSLSTINFGMLQNLSTQKVLFLTPSFKNNIKSFLSKTPPLYADGYRLLKSSGIFPNIGDGISDLGDALQLLKANGKDVFSKVIDGGSNIKDGAKEVYEILKIKADEVGGKLADQGYELLKLNKAWNFDLPSKDYPLVDEENFKIIIRYKAKKESKLDYNINSFASDFADQWRGRLDNISMVVSLGPLVEVMTVAGSFNTEKGKESNFGGSVSGEGLIKPEIEFSDAVKPVIAILEILEKLSTADYAAALQKGLTVAMSNSANMWEYKYEASKEIGLIRFPLQPLYDSPQTPLKLEASLSIGFNFNAALKVTDDPAELFPTAGAFFLFHGGLQVMCVSVAAATIYAIGNVDLKLSADSKPSLTVAMKFGFGAQLAVGLPVIGNVSIQFMMSIEIKADTDNSVVVTAIMMFRGRAEIFGGIVTVTITIEAEGSIKKLGNGTTHCKASVSFGLDISVAFIINISFHESWQETRQIA